MKIPFTPIHIKPKTIVSHIPENWGDAVPIWLNTNIFCNRISGGVTGFFRNLTLVKGPIYMEHGKEFHGIIKGEHIKPCPRS